MRATYAKGSHRRHKKVLRRAKGFHGGRGRLYTVAHATVRRAMAYQFRDRKVRKRYFRRLWIVRIGAAARPLGTSYSRLIGQLAKAKIAIDRKVLSDMAITDPAAFAAVVGAARAAS